MFQCPNCTGSLERQATCHGAAWMCPLCNGIAINTTVLRKAIRPEAINEAWKAAWEGTSRPGRNCPSCCRPMAEVPITLPGRKIPVDVCRSCQFFWFDPGELESMPLAPKPPRPDDHLPQATREAIAIMEVQRMAEDAREGDDGPDAEWESIPALLGLPVKAEAPGTLTVHMLTWVLVAALVACSLSAFYNPGWARATLGLIPSQWTRLGGLTLFASFFIHDSWMYFVANVWFLLMLGGDVEEFLGWKRAACLLLMGALMTDLTLILATPDSSTPHVGAGGGISAIITFYACKFPRTRICLLLQDAWMQLPAWAAFIVWIALQATAALLDDPVHFSPGAHIAPLGGCIAGLLFWLAWHKREPDAP